MYVRYGKPSFYSMVTIFYCLRLLKYSCQTALKIANHLTNTYNGRLL
jgi:hypothetical protein